jgi:gliding motility-associated lipoprotein GldH
MEEKTGKPFGSGWDILSHQLVIPTLTKYKFKQKGNYVFKLKQYMRVNPIKELHSIGLRIEKEDL